MNSMCKMTTLLIIMGVIFTRGVKFTWGFLLLDSSSKIGNSCMYSFCVNPVRTGDTLIYLFITPRRLMFMCTNSTKCPNTQITFFWVQSCFVLPVTQDNTEPPRIRYIHIRHTYYMMKWYICMTSHIILVQINHAHKLLISILDDVQFFCWLSPGQTISTKGYTIGICFWHFFKRMFISEGMKWVCSLPGWDVTYRFIHVESANRYLTIFSSIYLDTVANIAGSCNTASASVHT